MATTKTLTDKAIENAKAAAKGSRYVIWDKQVGGFGVRVTDKPVKTFILMKRVHGKLIRMSFGRYPETTLADAREKAGDALKLIDKGRDPRDEQARQKRDAARANAETVAVVAERVKRQHLAQNRSGHEAGLALDRDIVSAWGTRPIADITRRDVFDLLDAIEAKGTVYARNRRLALIRKFFNWALERDLIPANPAARISMLKETKRQRVLSDDELRAVWSAFDRMGAPFGDLGKVLLLTAQRRDEAAEMEWPEINGDVWVIPPEKAKNGVAHSLPLSPMVAKIITALPRYSGEDSGNYVFTTTNGRRPVSGFAKMKRTADALALQYLQTQAAERGDDPEKVEIPRWTLHDLRRTAATRMSGLGIDRLVIGKILNHVDSSVTGIYDRHAFDAEKRRSLDAWTRCLDGILHPKKQAGVVPFRRSPRQRRTA